MNSPPLYTGLLYGFTTPPGSEHPYSRPMNILGNLVGGVRFNLQGKPPNAWDPIRSGTPLCANFMTFGGNSSPRPVYTACGQLVGENAQQWDLLHQGDAVAWQVPSGTA